MPKCTASETIHKSPTLCSCFGVPETLVTDSGSQFIADSFKYFCSMIHLRSLPYHPQSNGKAERLVDNFKGALLRGGMRVKLNRL